ncbi:phosphoenolpyruvate carboxylase [Candidatus Woesearchaeota archaeon CG11_big_fil_rev_8_21_14_0_20_43_8]|nr:MAG: phosphoenolpyruvate carboxylase [Candidatus Woesearchaeota archaeon CG11_big_fil_rev_8_21_14_0_20_43_8]PIO05129.1 MAG: phosphoenolpyruvate carboxylase [Candidatus Woesearchaeota archaeon CG08_land_8_20_14_0_20_43_7]
MSTQHPDNVNNPFFADSPIIGGDDEIKEAFYAFSHLQSKEQLWDIEGKEVDNYVVKKLLSRYEPYFSKNRLGKDIFLTVRVPNPDEEKNESKIMLEALESIPRSFDISKAVYGDDVAPIFEIAVPMISNAKQVTRVHKFYNEHIIGRAKKSLLPGDISIGEWFGGFYPENISVIPLIEDIEHILEAHNIVRKHLENIKTPEYQRVWLARSDPALNYGSIAAVLANKIAAQNLHHLSDNISVELPTILGCGSAPFRGNFKPTNAISNGLKGFPSIQTFTIQSAYKYDYPEKEVRTSIEELNDTKRGRPTQIDEAQAKAIITKTSLLYKKQVALLAPLINKFSVHIPKRRKRKLHIGLFGYSRASDGVKLPRAITFCAVLYSLGLPPELLGLSTASEKELDFIRDVSPSFNQDMTDSLQFLNRENLSFFPPEIVKDIERLTAQFDPSIDRAHQKITSIILEDYKKNNTVALSENISRAASIRGFLG